MCTFNLKKKAFQFFNYMIFFSDTHFAYKIQKIEILFSLETDDIPQTNNSYNDLQT